MYPVVSDAFPTVFKADLANLAPSGVKKEVLLTLDILVATIIGAMVWMVIPWCSYSLRRMASWWKCINGGDVGKSLNSSVNLVKNIWVFITEADVVDEDTDFNLVQGGKKILVSGWGSIGEVISSGTHFDVGVLLKNFLLGFIEFRLGARDDEDVESTTSELEGISLSNSSRQALWLDHQMVEDVEKARQHDYVQPQQRLHSKSTQWSIEVLSGDKRSSCGWTISISIGTARARSGWTRRETVRAVSPPPVTGSRRQRPALNSTMCPDEDVVERALLNMAVMF
ncbi:hypothetical protein GCK72_010743 [Caenorhabditis remanei]|uniref:Uncharacterized protein n=1 Tax=Caenorhabditis remanei TaxID=31234 RepID=A0A6A5H6F7_CAERE|nr:hypothetical protein GCK72_010743 [Caenorhabditis remanei]KAF1762481.1 hypothetical protein GCK72_010743 [Caenorhabditis remanei]